MQTLVGGKNLHRHLLSSILGGNRNNLGFLQRSVYPSHFITMFFLISRNKVFIQGLCSYFTQSFLYHLKEWYGEKGESKHSKKTKEVSIEIKLHHL